jgi:hypothetical protein
MECDAFETLFLQSTPTREEFDHARRVLEVVDAATFTAAALRAVQRSGPDPTRMPAFGSSMWFRRGRSQQLGWKFLVAAPREHSFRQVTWWLTTDGQWLESDQSFQRSALQMTNTAPFELDRARLGQLLGSRSSRVASWLDSPGGRLNLGVE